MHLALPDRGNATKFRSIKFWGVRTNRLLVGLHQMKLQQLVWVGVSLGGGEHEAR